jgi:virginiamycin B lyase
MNAMSHRSRWIIVGGSLLVLGLIAFAESAAAAALTGTVSSAKEGAMEGVVVSAKKQGGTISVAVVSNADGRYSFPNDRLAAGTYDIAIRAVGYSLPATTATVGMHGDATLDLKLDAVTDPLKLGAQLSNAEWMISAGEAGDRLNGCVNCHTLALPMFSHYDPDAMAKVVQRMGLHTNNASVQHPWFDTDALQKLAMPPSKSEASLGAYIASINLSDRAVWPFELKTLPRPKGEDTQVIMTTYDLPRPDAAPHDEVFDADGNVWYSDFNSQYFGVLDPETGAVKEYAVPLRRPNGVAQGGLQVDFDPDGKLWFANMEQIQLIRFDPETEKMDIFELPVAEEDAADAHTTMIDPTRMHVDGNLWLNVAGGGEQGGEGAWRLNVASGQFTRVRYPEGSPETRAYDNVADTANNLWGFHMRNHNIWTTSAAKLETEWFALPEDRVGCRRGHMDSKERIWCGDFYGNGLVMFNTKTRKVEGNWTMPQAYTRPYDAEYDDKAYVWAGGMDSDLIVRLNPETGKLNQYLLPHETNIRNVTVWKGGPGELSSFWVGDQHGATLTHIEALTP